MVHLCFFTGTRSCRNKVEDIPYSSLQQMFIFLQPTAIYVYHMSIFRFSYGAVVGTNYLVVFVLLVIIYYKILKRIKRMRALHGEYISMAVANSYIFTCASTAFLCSLTPSIHTPLSACLLSVVSRIIM